MKIWIAEIFIIIISFIISIFIYCWEKIFKKYGHQKTKLDQLKEFDRKIKFDNFLNAIKKINKRIWLDYMAESEFNPKFIK